MRRRRGQIVWPQRRMALAVSPLLLLCPLYGAAAVPAPHGPVPQAVRAAAAAPATPTAYGDCGPGALPETGIQGEVPKADQESGRSKLGYRCNMQLVGQNTLDERGANMQLAWYKDCAYVSIIGAREFDPLTANPKVEGIGVIDASDPANPKQVETIVSPVGRNEHEALEVNARRGMLVAEVGGIAARYIEIYDVSKDCTHPQLKARYDSGAPTFHGLKISDDGHTIYATDGIGLGTPATPLHIIDVSDMSHPRLLAKWGPGVDARLSPYIIHDLDLSHDGTRAYLGAVGPATGIAVGLGLGGANDANTGPTLVTLDTSDIQERKPHPQLKVISQLDLPNFGHTIQRAVIGGKPFIVASGESPFANGVNCPWAWGYLVDMGDERHPKAVSQLKLAVNQTQYCARSRADNVTYSIHYVGVDDELNTTKVFYTYYGAGLRVFDVRDPAAPKEIAYYHPPAQPHTILQPLVGTVGGDAQTPAWDSATSVVRYRPESGLIWMASIGGGLSILRLTGRYACVPAAASARGAALGAAVLGRTRRAQTAALATPSRPAGPDVDRYCTTDGHALSVVYARRRAALALSDSPYASAHGIATGARVAELRAHVRRASRFTVGADTWFLAAGSGRTRAVYRTRGGLVREVGIADSRVTARRAAARRLLQAARSGG